MIIEMKDVFDGRGPLCHHSQKDVPSVMPEQKHREFACVSCNEPLRIEDSTLLSMMFRNLLGITCPKCGRNQGIGQVSKLMIVDFGTSTPAPAANLCRRALEEAEAYWKAVFELRLYKYQWIDAHILMCQSCDLAFKETEKAHRRKQAYKSNRGPQDWSPKGELP